MARLTQKKLWGTFVASINSKSFKEATNEFFESLKTNGEAKMELSPTKSHEIIDMETGFQYRDLVNKWSITIGQEGTVKLFEEHPDRITSKEFIKYEQLSLPITFWNKLVGLLWGNLKRIQNLGHELAIRETTIDVLKSDLENQNKKIAYVGTSKKEAFFAGMQVEKLKHVCNETV